jgi:hypothetical protein
MKKERDLKNDDDRPATWTEMARKMGLKKVARKGNWQLGELIVARRKPIVKK